MLTRFLESQVTPEGKDDDDYDCDDSLLENNQGYRESIFLVMISVSKQQ
jgi:hypothetical protein